MRNFLQGMVLLGLAMVVICTGSAAQAPIQLPDVVASARVESRSLELRGANPVRVRQLSRLIALHGGLREVASGGDFQITLDEVESTALRLQIASGGRQLWSQHFVGNDRLDALYLAADAMTARILGIPGFFRSRIAFVSDRSGHPEIYTADLLLASARQWTRDRSEALSPNYHPDGSVLLYTSYHGTGFPDIYRIDLRTGQRTVFAGYKGTNSGATFSPDGSQVAMVLSGPGNAEIFVSDVHGRNLRRLTRTNALEADPAWSPDGSRLVFTSDQMGRPQLYVMDANGNGYTRLRTDISRNCSEPAWNPRNANLIAFTAAMAGEFEVCVFDMAAGQSRVVSSGAGDAVHPVWLRDGRHLIYTERTRQYTRLMILDTVSGQRARLTAEDMGNARQASWFYP